MASEFEEGVLVGLLVGEGHFGGDGRQPQATLRMHERHEALFRWLERAFPGGRLYGPYDHGGRRYYQWMARGAFLRDELVPLLRRSLTPSLDRYAHGRFAAMLERYSRQLGTPSGAPRRVGGPSDEDPGRDEDPGDADSGRATSSEVGGTPPEAGGASRGGASPGGEPPTARASEIFAALRRAHDPRDTDPSPCGRRPGVPGRPPQEPPPQEPRLRSTRLRRAGASPGPRPGAGTAPGTAAPGA